MWADTPVVQYVEAPSYLMYIIAGALLLALGAAVLILRSRRRQETVLAPAAAGLDVVVTDEMVEALTQAEKDMQELRSKVTTIAQEKPRDVAQLIRTWLAED